MQQMFNYNRRWMTHAQFLIEKYGSNNVILKDVPETDLSVNDNEELPAPNVVSSVSENEHGFSIKSNKSIKVKKSKK